MPPFCDEHAMFHRYYGEHGDMRRAALAAQRDAARRERAEQIAAEVLEKNYGDPTPGAFSAVDALQSAIRRRQVNAAEVRHMLTAAALQALTETENAR